MAGTATRVVALSLVWGLLQTAGPAQTPGILESGLKEEISGSLEKGLAYLKARQKEDGSWENHPGITGLAALAFLREPGVRSDGIREHVRRSLDYLASLARPNGAIYDKDLPGYNTAVALQALSASGDPKYRGVIEKGRDYILTLQTDEGEGYTEEDQFWGGIGYGSDLRPDLSNLEQALHALKAAGLSADHPAWLKALKFVQRTQNYSERNDQAWAGDDGGFVYYPGFSYARSGGTSSYGSMTYAGLMSYSYASVSKEDPRVQAALEWIRRNYTVEENPGMGLTTLYYYYLVFAKALNAYEEPVIVDAEGVSHNWREDLGRKLLAEQHEEGYWVNTDPAYWQDNKVLVTAFAALAIEEILGRP